MVFSRFDAKLAIISSSVVKGDMHYKIPRLNTEFSRAFTEVVAKTRGRLKLQFLLGNKLTPRDTEDSLNSTFSKHILIFTLFYYPGIFEVICFYMGSRNSFANYPYSFFFLFHYYYFFCFVNMPLNCNK